MRRWLVLTVVASTSHCHSHAFQELGVLSPSATEVVSIGSSDASRTNSKNTLISAVWYLKFMGSGCILPPELIYRILHFLGPRDITRLRTVSNEFFAITHDPVLWRSLYGTAPFPCYPGPFPTQPTEFLRSTLIQSERLEKTWITEPLRCTSTREFQLGLTTPFPDIINGKWIIGCASKYRAFVAHDIDSGSSRVLWDEAERLIYSWDASFVTTKDGLFVYIVLSYQSSSSWKLLEFRVDSDSGYLYHSLTLDVPTRHPRHIVLLDSSQSPRFLYIFSQKLIFDSRTKLFYEFPEFRSRLFNAVIWNFDESVVTNTHIIRFYCCSDPTVSPPVKSTLIQAFTLPSSVRADNIGVLCLSHEGIIQDHPDKYTRIRNSIVDPMTGSTTIRFLHEARENDILSFSCVDVVLSKQSHPDTVLPITLNTRGVAQIDCGAFNDRTHMIHTESSADGHVRGFVRFAELDNNSVPLISGDLAVKFTLEASGERCIAAFGPATQSQVHRPFPFTPMWFDSVRGRLCHANYKAFPDIDETHNTEYTVVVMDFE